MHVTCMLHENFSKLHELQTLMKHACLYLNVHACFMQHAWIWDVFHAKHVKRMLEIYSTT